MKTACRTASFLLASALLAALPARTLLAQTRPAPGSIGDVRTENRVEPLKSGSKLWVKNRNGIIRVTGWDREEVVLAAQVSDTERRRIRLELRRKGPDLEIEVIFQQPTWSLDIGPVSTPRCEMSLNVPRKVLGYFRTTNGGITVSGVEGYARCESCNGDIRLQDISGEARAETTNGAIEVRNLRARIKGSTTNGRILLENVEGGVELITTNGAITARNLDGWGEGISLESTNEGIHVELGKATGELIAQSANGSLDVKLPGSQILELTRHSARLKLPGRSQKISLSTTNGGITIRP